MRAQRLRQRWGTDHVLWVFVSRLWRSQSPLACINARTVLKNVGAGPVKSAIVVMFCVNLILAYEASFCVHSHVLELESG